MQFVKQRLPMILAAILLVIIAVSMLTGHWHPSSATGIAVLGAGITLDVFKADGFSLIGMTDAINKIPFIPGRAGKALSWDEQGVETTSIMLEEQNGVLTLINPSPRGGPGDVIAKQKRTARVLVIPHYQRDDKIMADEVQGVRAFGTENVLLTVQSKVTARMTEHVQSGFDPTLEYQRMGALKGIILNGDGSTLYNLFTEFNVAQPTEVAFDLTAASPASGAVRTKCTQIVRTIGNALGGIPYTGVGAFCSDTFWDDLIANKEVRDTYQAQEAAQLRAGAAWVTLSYGGILFENYRGSVGNTQFATTDKAHFFPLGVPGLFRTRFAPADYIETVNTIGLPRYAKQWEMDNGKGINIEMQSNALSYCTRPGVLVQGRRGA